MLVNVYTRFGYGQIDLNKYESLLQQKVDNPNDASHTVIVQIQFRRDTCYGYIQVSLLPCNLINQRREIKSRIDVNVKTMFGQRLVHKFEVNVNENISKLIQLLEDKESKEMQKYHTCRLVYPMGSVRTLKMDQSF